MVYVLLRLLQGYGKIQVVGGNGATSPHVGGAGSGGRIAVYFESNKTYSGSFDAYGGDGGGDNKDGSPGTIFFFHTGREQTDYDKRFHQLWEGW